MNCRLAAALSAALLIPGTAFSSGLTLYGVVDTGLRYSHTASEGTTADSLQMMSGQNAGSRFGFKGGESLGSGWSTASRQPMSALPTAQSLSGGSAPFLPRPERTTFSSGPGTLLMAETGSLPAPIPLTRAATTR